MCGGRGVLICMAGRNEVGQVCTSRGGYGQCGSCWGGMGLRYVGVVQ
jgi:hypothetical protein